MLYQNYAQIAPWAISGAILGGTDKARKYRGGIDIQYATITSVIGVMSLWLSKFLLPAIMPISYTALVRLTIIIVVATTVQYYLSSRSLKGIKKRSLQVGVFD